jgi:hypothetical protein
MAGAALYGMPEGITLIRILGFSAAYCAEILSAAGYGPARMKTGFWGEGTVPIPLCALAATPEGFTTVNAAGATAVIVKVPSSAPGAGWGVTMLVTRIFIPTWRGGPVMGV